MSSKKVYCVLNDRLRRHSLALALALEKNSGLKAERSVIEKHLFVNSHIVKTDVWI